MPIRAAVCREFGQAFEIEPIEIDPPEADEVEVAIAACAVCHSDLTAAGGGWGGVLPAVYGHEAAGIVTSTGAQSGFASGQRVLVTMIRACGACPCCQAGYVGSCTTAFPRAARTALRDARGRPVVQGLGTAAFAERAVVHRSQCVALPDDLPLAEASLLACGVMTGWGAVMNTAEMRRGSTVAVIGCGGVGINCIQAARIGQADRIIAIDLAEERLEQARRFGATDVVSALGAGTAVHDLTGGLGVDYVFIAAGVRPAIEQAFALLAPMGTAVLVGIPPTGTEVSFDPVAFACGPHRLLGSKLHADPARDVPRLIEHWRSGRLKLSELVTARFPLDRINDAFAETLAGRGLRTVVEIAA